MDDYEKAYNEQFMRAEKLEERIKELKELEETIYNIRYPHTTNPDEYVGDEIGGE